VARWTTPSRSSVHASSSKPDPATTTFNGPPPPRGRAVFFSSPNVRRWPHRRGVGVSHDQVEAIRTQPVPAWRGREPRADHLAGWPLPSTVALSIRFRQRRLRAAALGIRFEPPRAGQSPRGCRRARGLGVVGNSTSERAGHAAEKPVDAGVMNGDVGPDWSRWSNRCRARTRGSVRRGPCLLDERAGMFEPSWPDEKPAAMHVGDLAERRERTLGTGLRFGAPSFNGARESPCRKKSPPRYRGGP